MARRIEWWSCPHLQLLSWKCLRSVPSVPMPLHTLFGPRNTWSKVISLMLDSCLWWSKRRAESGSFPGNLGLGNSREWCLSSVDAELLILRTKADALSYGGKASLVRRKQQIQNGGDERVSPEKETGQSAAFVSLQFPDTFPINVLYFTSLLLI